MPNSHLTRENPYTFDRGIEFTRERQNQHHRSHFNAELKTKERKQISKKEEKAMTPEIALLLTLMHFEYSTSTSTRGIFRRILSRDEKDTCI